MSSDRRGTLRVRDTRLITEIVKDQPHAASIVNLNANGLFTIKPTNIGLQGPQVVQVEIPVPEASESVWAVGKVVFEALSPENVGSGIHFFAMADRHRRLLDDLVEMRRKEMMARIMREIRLRKELGAHPSPYTAPPPMIRQAAVSPRILPKRPQQRMIVSY